MLGSTPLSAILGSGLDNTDHHAVRGFIRAACGAGLSLLLVYPNSKLPADMRTARQRTAADKAAQLAARDEGRRNWATVKSPSGLALASTDAKVVLKYLDAYIGKFGDDVPVNLAVEVGGSRLVVVDCDTAAQLARFLDVADAPDDLPPTVVTPGQRGPDGTMVHSDGGHFYFTVPDGVELPDNLGAMTWGGDDGFAVLWRSRYVLIPPSTRPEGRYELVGRDYPLPEWLHEALTKVGHQRAQRAERTTPVDGDLATAVDEWAGTVPWSDVLAPLGWAPAPRADNCGCEVWTAPGVHGSPKSATAHDAGCQLGRYTETNAPLHIWTDNPGPPFDTWVEEHGTQTLSKLQAVAAAEFDGNVGKAMDTLGLVLDLSIAAEMGANNTVVDQLTTPGSLDSDIPKPAPPLDDIATLEDIERWKAEGKIDPDVPVTFPDSVDRPDPDVFDSDHRGMPRIAPFSHWRDLPPPEYIIEGLIEHGGLSCVIGPPGVGKSSVVLDMACHIAAGKHWQGRRTLKTKVLYLPGEGLSGAVQRVRAWEQAHDIDLEDNLLMGNGIILAGAHPDAWAEVSAYIARQGIGLIVFDTFARMALGVEENSATEVGKIVMRFDQVRELTNAGVLVVHHTSKAAPSIGRGSNALNGALDSELLVQGGWSMVDDSQLAANGITGKPIELSTTKQKNVELMDDPIALLMVSFALDARSAPLIVGPNGDIDPMVGDIVLARPVAETVIETAVRIRLFVDRLPQQGATRSELAAGVEMDAYTRSRSDSAKHWRQKVSEAVDRALRYGLVDTLTGTPAGSRYIPGTTGVEQARLLAAAEVIGAGD